MNKVKNQPLREVVLVGGGHSHIQVIRNFASAPPARTHCTVVVDRPIAIYSGMVPGFVAGQYQQRELEIDVEHLTRQAGFSLIVEKAVGIDAAQKRILLESGSCVSYDMASLDIGSIVSGLDVPGVKEHGIAPRPIHVFNRRMEELIREVRILPAEATFRVVVVGGGAGGVELAFALRQRLQKESPASVELLILQSGSRILTGYPASLVRRVNRQSRKLGIKIQCNRRVRAVRGNGVEIAGGEQIACQAVLWITGPESQPIFRSSRLPTDERGFVRVRSTLQVEGYDELFAVGDCATLIEHPETAKAGVYAVRQGPYLARNIRALLTGRPLRFYRPQDDFLMLLNLGNGTALGSKWGYSFEGRWVMKLKDRIDRRFMSKFQSIG